MQRVSADALKGMLADGEEIALIDGREELIFSRGHLLFARCVPLSRLELLFASLVPRADTRVALCDEANGLAERAAQVLTAGGYRNLFVLDGGIAAWSASGLELFSGVNVPSKAFGEYVEHAAGTPSISADELDPLIRDGADLVVLDSRPFDEYRNVSIPRGINVPGAELVLRIRDVAPSPHTMVVVNCAGRTRSIIGAQSLINAGIPNKVVALRNGTMGWALSGRTCERGMARRAPEVSEAALAWAQGASAKVAASLGIEHIDRGRLQELREDCRRTLYLFDVRDPAEYARGHVPGAVSAPGGQLVQATDQYVGTLGARIVLADEAGVRAVMTASWLRQMGWRDVFVLPEAGGERRPPPARVLGPAAPESMRIGCAELADLIARDACTVVDLSLSREYRRAHLPGAWFAIRSRLARALEKIAPRGTLVLTSEDGAVAALAAPEARALVDCPVRWLAGGNAGWEAAGHPLTSAHARMADEAVDVWLKPYERPNDTREAMDEYLAWEIDLLPRIRRDGSARFALLQGRG
jgi:rhodanese-related sulfurtransferase